MTKEQGKAEVISLQAVLERDRGFIRAAMRPVVQPKLEAETTEALGAEKGERTGSRSTREAKAVTEALCGHSFSGSSISAVNKELDAGLRAFAERRLAEADPYLTLDACYERVREAGVMASQAVLIAVAADGEGRRP